MRLANQNTIPAYKRRGTASLAQLDFTATPSLIGFGDSFMNSGLQASPIGTPSPNSYFALISSTTGIPVAANRGAIGTGIWTAMSSHLQSDPFPRVSGIISMTGLNDSNRNGTDAAFVAFWKEQYRSFIYANMITSGIPGSDMTLTGGWFGHETAGASYNKAHQFGAGKKPILNQSLAANSAAYTFSGKDHVIMQYMISTDSLPSYTWLGTLEVKIDGNVVDTIDCHVAQGQNFPGWENGNTNYLWRAKMYTGLSLGSHTLSVRMTANPSGGTNIDYVGHLGDGASDTEPMLIGHITYIPDYAQAAPYNIGSNAAANAVNDAIDELVAEVKAVRPNAPILSVPVNTREPLLVPGDWHGDGIHPINSGHDKLKTKFLSAMIY